MKQILMAVLTTICASPLAFADGGNQTRTTGPVWMGGWSEGFVRSVDKDAGKALIDYRPLGVVDAPLTTAVFEVKDGSLLGRLNPGERVTFRDARTASHSNIIEVARAR